MLANYKFSNWILVRNFHFYKLQTNRPQNLLRNSLNLQNLFLKNWKLLLIIGIGIGIASILDQIWLYMYIYVHIIPIIVVQYT